MQGAAAETNFPIRQYDVAALHAQDISAVAARLKAAGARATTAHAQRQERIARRRLGLRSRGDAGPAPPAAPQAAEVVQVAEGVQIAEAAEVAEAVKAEAESGDMDDDGEEEDLTV